MTSAVAAPVVGVDRLVAHLCALDLPRDRPVLVHSSLRAIGVPSPRAATMLAALRQALGDHVTLVVPTQTPNNSLSSNAYRRVVDGMSEAQERAYRRSMPGFDAATTPSFGVGALAEAIRCAPGAVRSAHPQTSFAALGPEAVALMRRHDLDCHLGNRSPLGALYEAHAVVLLLGVGYESCTAFHFAEYFRDDGPTREYECFVRADGERVPRRFTAPHLDDSDFDRIGAALETQSIVRHGRVGHAHARVLGLRDSVHAALAWMDIHRQP